MTMWFYRSRGEEHGPVSGAALKRLAHSGELGPQDAVRQDTASECVQAARIRGLFQPETGDATESTGRSCPTCGLVAAAEHRFCIGCGAALTDAGPAALRRICGSLWASADRQVIRQIATVLLWLNVTILLVVLFAAIEGPSRHASQEAQTGFYTGLAFAACMTVVYIILLLFMQRAPAALGIAYLSIVIVLLFYEAISMGLFQPGDGTHFAILLFSLIGGIALYAAIFLPIIRRGLRLPRLEA